MVSSVLANPIDHTAPSLPRGLGDGPKLIGRTSADAALLAQIEAIERVLAPTTNLDPAKTAVWSPTA